VRGRPHDKPGLVEGDADHHGPVEAELVADAEGNVHAVAAIEDDSSLATA
jgi:hypothetical protein